MAFQVFLIPSLSAAEQALIWQLQTLGQAYGLTLKVARRTRHTMLSSVDTSEIKRSDAIVAIVTEPPNAWATAEINAARKARRPLYFLVEHTIAARMRHQQNIIVFNRNEGIERVVAEIHRIVERERSSREMKTTIGWLLGIGAALFALGALNSSDK